MRRHDLLFRRRKYVRLRDPDAMSRVDHSLDAEFYAAAQRSPTLPWELARRRGQVGGAAVTSSAVPATADDVSRAGPPAGDAATGSRPRPMPGPRAQAGAASADRP